MSTVFNIKNTRDFNVGLGKFMERWPLFEVCLFFSFLSRFPKLIHTTNLKMVFPRKRPYLPRRHADQLVYAIGKPSSTSA